MYRHWALAQALGINGWPRGSTPPHPTSSASAPGHNCFPTERVSCLRLNKNCLWLILMLSLRETNHKLSFTCNPKPDHDLALCSVAAAGPGKEYNGHQFLNGDQHAWLFMLSHNLAQCSVQVEPLYLGFPDSVLSTLPLLSFLCALQTYREPAFILQLRGHVQCMGICHSQNKQTCRYSPLATRIILCSIEPIRIMKDCDHLP